MANYYGSARSNYFRVKDAAAFKAWAESLGLDVWESDEKHEGQPQYGITPIGTDDGVWPSYRWDDEECEEIDLPAELAKHLHPDDVAILMEAGAEKLRYITGQAVAVNASGEVVQVTLRDIYEEAYELGKHVTACEY